MKAKAIEVRQDAPSTGNFSLRGRIISAGLLAVVLIVGLGGWAAKANLTGAIIAQGKVVVRSQVKLVQHRDGGIVAEIRAANGDHVQAGDLLIRLDETQTKAELGVIQSQLTELRGRRARLIAERDGAQAIAFANGFESTAQGAEIAKGEIRLFDENRAVREARHVQLGLQVEQYEEQVHALVSQQNANEGERKMVSEDLARLRPLLDRQFIELNKIRAIERDLVKVDGLKGEIAANIARVRGQISETRSKMIEADQQIRTDSQKELREVDGKIAELAERSYAAQDRLSRTQITAPITGYVNDLSVHTVNGVIAPKETLMSVVPDDAELIVEAKVMPNDIDQIVAGQQARMRFTAFNQRSTPEIAGKLQTIGAAASQDTTANNQTYYLATIGIAGHVKKVAGKPIVPGMPVEVFLSTDDRTALSYLAKPFTDQMMRAFREE